MLKFIWYKLFFREYLRKMDSERKPGMYENHVWKGWFVDKSAIEMTKALFVFLELILFFCCIVAVGLDMYIEDRDMRVSELFALLIFFFLTYIKDE